MVANRRTADCANAARTFGYVISHKRQRMCTIVILRRPGHPWPVLLAANRDEMSDRPWRAPARHWPDRPELVGGQDSLGGGTWLAVNDAGVVAAVLNRINTLGPAPGRRSRGELPLLALGHPCAEQAAASLARVDPLAYRPFNMMVADHRHALWIRGSDGSEASAAAPSVVVEPVPPGVSMITAYDRNDLSSPRTRRYLFRFAAAPAPQPETENWRDWIALLASRDHDPDAGPGGAMTVVTATGFGTLCASLIALPAAGCGRRPIWLFASGRPGAEPFQPVASSGRPL